MKEKSVNAVARWTFYVSGAILVIAGIFAVFNPFAAVVSAAVLMGAGLLLAGINEAIAYFSIKSSERPVWMLVMCGINLAMGVFFLLHVGMAIFTVTALAGIWVLLSGGIRTYLSFKMRSAAIDSWWIMLVSGILMILLGIVLLANPFAAVITVAAFMAISLIGVGVLTILEGRATFPSAKHLEVRGEDSLTGSHV